MKFLIVPVLILSLFCAACTPAQQVTLLTAAVAAGDAAVAALATTGSVDPVTAAEVISVLTPIPASANAILAEWNSTDTKLVKVAKIDAAAKPVITALLGVSPVAAPWVSATLAAWNAFLASVDPTFVATPALQAHAKVVILPTNANVNDLKAAIAKMQADLANFPIKAVVVPAVK